MKIQSKKLRDSARGQSCTLRVTRCTSDDTVVLCHLPVGMRGTGIKSPDLFAVFGCVACHDAIDGRAKADFDARDLLRALAETQMIWLESGLLKIEGLKT
jgi:hypothetical protein